MKYMIDELQADVERLTAERDGAFAEIAQHVARTARQTEVIGDLLDELRSSHGDCLFNCNCQAAAEKMKRLQEALYEVTTNGEWTKGEQLGDWAISKEVYETARDALNEQSASPAPKNHGPIAKAAPEKS